MSSSLLITPGPVMTVTLNRPDVRNAFNEELIDALAAWAESVPADGSVRAVVLQGAGSVFCAGADVQWMSKMVNYTREQNLEDAHRAARMLHAIDSVPVPVIGRIQGAALGGGAGLAAVCDVVVASDDAVFGFTEVVLGILPAMISPYVVSKIGLSFARELCLSGVRFSAARAKEIGLAHEIVSADRLDLTVDKHVQQFRKAAPSAIAATKKLLREVAGHRPADVMSLTVDAIARQRVSQEGQEGLRAFLEKRTAAWAADTPQTEALMRRVLIANRGEIARRIIRTCREMGLATVAVYSEVDADAPYVSEADQAVPIGPAPAADSYLNIPRVIEAARRSKADAVHPGYGFLSENPAFADACAQAGLTFVGPPGAVIRRTGSKTAARASVSAAGVPIVPGDAPASQDEDDILQAMTRVGFPVLLKATSGGGGRGMRIVRQASEGAEAIGLARREAQRAFADGTLYVERLIERPRHVEVQIFADQHGHVAHVLERDCTLQRRHQKVIEETPAPSLAPSVRARLTEAAVAAARAVGYVNAGTVEFLVEGEGDAATFYFLEVNTRLQVEHPITEAITGFDLVRAQLLVAAGEPLPFAQADVRAHGHAIECRIYAEDSLRLLPQSGRLLRYREPSGPGIRVDSGVREGQNVTVHYDPLLAKLIAHGATREEALARMTEALGQYEILGVRHNLAFLRALLARPEVVRHDVHTRFIEEHLDELTREPRAALAPAAAALAALVAMRGPAPAAVDAASQSRFDPWQTLGPISW